ncbi:hypothetical protein [Rhodoplanes sp. SY1]|uniref:hypothetical protein n=1 Tax=Rhodoplanes sp. SY1 TaxID=3166646 RepID=UPI0038B59076
MALVVCIPLLSVADGLPVVGERGAMGALMIAVGLGLAIVVASLRPGETAQLRRALAPVVPLVLVPVVWTIVQLVPVPGLAHPIWASAASALGASVYAPVTIDLGGTVVALCTWLLALALVLTSAAATIDRGRAEWTLATLAGGTAAMALVVVSHDLSGATFLGELQGRTRAAFDTAAALGVVTALAYADLVFERYETRHRRGAMSTVALVERLSLALVALFVCVFAIGFFRGGVMLVAALSGAATFALVVVVRRMGGIVWLGWGLAAAAAVVVVMSLAALGGVRDAPLAIRFAEVAPGRFDAAQRLIADATATGTGAGTTARVLSSYQEGAVSGLPGAPTTVAALAIELGTAAPWIALLMAAVIAGLLIRGALKRGRDSFYAAAAAGCVVTLAIGAFHDASLLGLGPMVLACLVLGLGLAQRLGQSSR